MADMTPQERKKLIDSDKKRLLLKEKLKNERERHEEVLVKLQKEFVKKRSIDEEIHLSKIKGMQQEMEKNGAEILKILQESESKRGGISNSQEIQDLINSQPNQNPNTLKQPMKKRT